MVRLGLVTAALSTLLLTVLLAVSSGTVAADTDVNVTLGVNHNGIFTEGTELTVTAKLATVATANVTIPITFTLGTAAASDFSLSDSSAITISSGSRTGTLTLTAINDRIDENNETFTLGLGNLPSGYAKGTPSTVAITIIDNDTAGITITQSGGSTSVSEDGTTTMDSYTVELNSQPTFPVQVLITSATPTIAWLDGPDASTAFTGAEILTFTGSNWGIAQTIRVQGYNDNIDNTGNSRSVIISHETSTIDAKYRALAAQTVSVTVTDDDTAGVTISESTRTVAESSGTATYTVVLDSEPTADVMVTMTSSVSGAAVVDGSDADAVGSASETLTFTSGNWNTAQTVTVIGVNNNVDDSGDQRTSTISHSVASPDTKYNALSAVASVAVTVTDDDTASAGVTLSESKRTVAEAAGTATYTVVLDSQPTSDVMVTMTSSVSGAAVVDGSDADAVGSAAETLTFTSGNWNTAQTVTVIGVNNNVDDSGDQRTSTISHSVASPDTKYNALSAVASVAVTVTDDDTAGVTITQSSGSTSVSENAGVDSYTVVLDSKPMSSVSVAVSSGTASAALIDGPDTPDPDNPSASETLTFTTANWNTPQMVTVTGVNDNIDNPTNQRSSLITHDISSSDAKYNALADETVSVTVIDDDNAGVTISESTLTVAEAAGTATYTVVLTSEPTSDVTVTMTSGTPGAAVVDGSDAGTVGSTAETLTFTSSTWDTAQTVTVIGVNNAIDDPGDKRTSTVSHTVSSSDLKYSALTGLDSVSVTVTDEDGAGVTISESTRTVAENAGMQMYTVKLDSQPTHNVTVTITSDTPAAVRVDGPGGNTTPKTTETLTFTTSSWATAQTVTVTGVNDNLDNTDNKRSAKLTHAFSSTDTNYSSISDRDVTVTVTDDDATPEVDLSVDLSSVAESAGSMTVTVTATVDDAAIRFEAEKTVRVTVRGSAGDEFVDFTIPAAFNITIASSAATGTGTFALVPTNDDINERDETVTVSGASTGLTVNSTSLMLTDDEADPIVTIKSPDVSSITEGQTAQFVVAPVSSELMSKPDSKGLSAFDLTINLTVAQTGSFVSSTNLGNKTVVLPALAEQVSYDVDTVNDNTVESNGRVTLSVRSASGYMTAGGSNSRSITVNDNDAGVAVNLSIDDATITEDDNTGSTITVTLASAAPSSGVTIPLTTTNNTAANSDYSLSATSVTISSGQTTNTVKITAPGDTTDEPSETFSVSLGNLPAGYAAGTTSSVDVTIADNDATTVTLTRAAGATLTEGSTLTYTLTLGRALVAGEALAVPLAFSGTATRNTDYTLACVSANGVACANLDSGNAMVTFTGGTNAARVVTITLTAATDSTVEASGETVNVGLGTLNANSGTNLGGGAAGTDNAAMVTIEDPAPTDIAVTLSVDSNGAVTEGGTRTITATLASAAPANVTIPLNTATADYSLSKAGIDITSGAMSGTVTLTATDDNIDEPSETVTLRFNNLPSGYIAGDPSAANVTIADNDPTTVTLSRVAGASIIEGATLDYTLTLGRALVDGEILPVPLTFAAGSGTATRGTDYTLDCASATGVACTNLNTGNAMVTFTGGTNAARVVIIILTAATDSTVEASGETVDINLGTLTTSSGTNLGGGATGTDTAASVAINDPVVATPSVTVTQTGGTTRVAENGGTDTYTIVLGTEPTADVLITVTSSTPSAARIDGPDAATNPTATETLTFTSSNYNTAQTITVTGINDNIDNPGNQRSSTISHSVTSSSASEYRNINIANVAVIVIDDDTTPQPQPQPRPRPTPQPRPQPTPQPTPEPEPEPEPEPVFEDLAEIPEVHREAVTELANEGVFEQVGCQTDHLCPDQPVKRWQLAVILVRQFEGTEPETDTEPETEPETENTFSDVEDIWWSTYVQHLSELELTNGCTRDSLCLDQQLTRAQAAHFIVKALDLQGNTETSGFNDIEGNPHTAAINALFAAGITKGCYALPLQFCPDRLITLQEFATMMFRAAENLNNKKP